MSVTNDMFNLRGKTVLVTGGNSGLGLAFARGMVRHGANAILWGRNGEKNAAAVAELSKLGTTISAQIVDVTDEAQVVAGFAEAVRKAGKIDCFVQNAGFANPAASFMEMSSDQYHAQIDVALNGGFYTLREAARHMSRRAAAGDRGGSIILCGSGTVFAGIAGMEHYGAAKAGLAAMMRGMATELARFGVRVNMIAPGYIKTDLGGGDKLAADMEAMFAQRTPVGRVGSPADLEAAAVYLACDASSFHTGDILNIDGGWRASYF
jgi:NAD(P)-dependent dehydrogenase (short-subunit alcohol dehydrogenase family)